MSKEKNPSLLDLLEELLALPADQREQRLQPLAPEQRELLRKWLGGEADDASKLIPSQQSLLRALNQALNAGGGGTLPMTESGGAPLAPTVVGPYHILEKLGEGGMGTVYKAEQRTPIKRIVAIKLIKPGFDTHEVIARFNSERQALARIDHPSIAKVLEAGTDEQGRPYFAMEYVPGVPITRFADENKLSIQQRLELFLQVCDAINYSHTKAIIHRDIKSSNVLAYLKEGKPTVKVIDFGIAKALTGDRLTDRTFNTGDGSVIGSYDSMSPEQARGSSDIDTRTDVYSLGALLYELLTGAKPFAAESLQKAADEEIRRIIREVEPLRPSTRLTSMGKTATKIAQSRQAKVDVLAKQLRDELEWIPLKAMRKERQRRYASPLQLAEDVQNYLDQKPLLAGPETKAYLVKKYLHRHRVPVAIGITIASLLVGGIVGISLLYARAENLRHRSDAATVLAREANREADHQAARAKTESNKVRRQLVESWSARGVGYEQQSESALAMLSFAKALEVAGTDPELGRIPRTQLRLLNQLERWPQLQLRESQYLASDATFSPQGDLICIRPSKVAVRNYATGRRIATMYAGEAQEYRAAAMNASQSLLTVAGIFASNGPSTKGFVVLYDGYTQHELHRQDLDFVPTHVTFSDNGKCILVESAEELVALDTSSFEMVPLDMAESQWLSPERLSRDGGLVVVSRNTGKPYGDIYVARMDQGVWSTPMQGARESVNRIRANIGSTHLIDVANVNSFRFSGDGTGILAAKLYDAELVSLERSTTNVRRQQFNFDQRILDVDWNERAHLIAFLLKDGTIQLYSNQVEVSAFWLTSIHDTGAFLVRISPDGQSVISFGPRGRTSIWNVSKPTWKPMREMFRRAEESGSDLSLNWDKTPQVLSGSAEVAPVPDGPNARGLTEEYLHATGDGKWLVYASNPLAGNIKNRKTDIAIVPVTDPARVKHILIAREPVLTFGNSPSVSERGELMALPWERRICKTTTGEIFDFSGDLRRSRVVSDTLRFVVAPNGESATMVDEKSGIWRWDAIDGKVRGPYGGAFSSAAVGELVSPDARWAIRSDFASGILDVLDASSGDKRISIAVGQFIARCLWTSQNFLLVGTNRPNDKWQLWDPRSGGRIATLEHLPCAYGWIDATRRFLAAADNNIIQVFDLRTRLSVGKAIPFQGGSSDAILFPDGRYLLSITSRPLYHPRLDVDIIDVSSGHLIFPRIPIDGLITGAIFPNGHECLLSIESTFDGVAGLLALDLSESAKAPEKWKSLGELYSNCRLDDVGVVESLPYPERIKMWFAANGSAPLPTSSAGDFLDSSDLLDMSHKVSTLQRDGHLDQAVALTREIVENSKRLFVLGDARTISYQSDYAELLIGQKKFGEAVAVLLDALSAAREVQDRGLQIKTHELLADLYRTWGKADLALEHARQAKSLRPSTQPTVRAASTSNAKK